MRASGKRSLAVLGRSLLQRKSYAAAPETGGHAISCLHALISMRNLQSQKRCPSGAQLLALPIRILEHICNPLLTLYVPYAKHIAV